MKTDKKRILFIIWSYSYGGGAEALLTTIVNHLSRQKYEIGIVEFLHVDIKREPVNSDVKIYPAITEESDAEKRKKTYYVHEEPEKVIYQYIPRDYDLYVSFNYQIPTFLLPPGSRNITWIHTDVYDLAEKGMEHYRELQRRAFEKIHKIVSISQITTKSIKDVFPESTDKIVEILNATNADLIRQKARYETDVKLNHPAIVIVGRLEERKNPLRMLDIYKKVCAIKQDVHLYFLGKGALEAEIKEKANQLCFGDKVHFLGYADNPFPIMKQADVSCITSKTEGFLLCLLESLALNVPFVSTDVGAARILTNDGKCGMIYESDDEAVKYILNILEKGKKAYREECEESARRFDLDRYIEQIEQLFDEVLQIEESGEKEGFWRSNPGELEDKNYYLRFPEELLSQGKRVILYGAGDIGTNYYEYINETGCCDLIAWVDCAAEKHRKNGRDVSDLDVLEKLEYDAVIIAVMDERTAQSIRQSLNDRGISDAKILWAPPIY